MKYRTESSNRSLVAQSFSYIEPEYKLDKKTGQLVIVGEVDIAKEIQSNSDCALSAILDKFLGVPLLGQQRVMLNNGNEVFDHAGAKTDLTELGTLMQKGEELRSKYGLPDTMTTEQIFALVAKAEADAKAKLQNLQNGGITDETSQDDTQSE